MNTECFINDNIYHHSNITVFQLRSFKTDKKNLKPFKT